MPIERSGTGRPRIVFDGRWTCVDSGIGQYSYWLARHLPEAIPECEVHVLARPGEDPFVERLLGEELGLHVHRLAADPLAPRGIFELLRWLFRERPAIYHAPDWFAPPLRRAPWCTVLSLHDLIPLAHPEWVPRSRKARWFRSYRWALRRSVACAAAVLTDTVWWARRIAELLPVDPARIHVAAPGVAPAGEPKPEEVARVLRRFGLDGRPYLLAVGRGEPYKGFVELVEAFAGARRDEVLVLVGRADPRYRELERVIERLGLTPKVRRLARVAPEELTALYAGARAFATLSRVEGFGLPPLEAMAHGVPVLAPQTPVFREVLGEGALLVHSLACDVVAPALRRLLDDEALRGRLRSAGRQQAERYRWSRCAAQVADVYRRLLVRRAEGRLGASLADRAVA